MKLIAQQQSRCRNGLSLTRLVTHMRKNNQFKTGQRPSDKTKAPVKSQSVILFKEEQVKPRKTSLTKAQLRSALIKARTSLKTFRQFLRVQQALLTQLKSQKEDEKSECVQVDTEGGSLETSDSYLCLRTQDKENF